MKTWYVMVPTDPDGREYVLAFKSKDKGACKRWVRYLLKNGPWRRAWDYSIRRR